ncbi:MAG: hypothetical protein HQK71_03675 [Desulfamplus sp.]|nr:hypothetical protein [Desulfamplus sp.]
MNSIISTNFIEPLAIIGTGCRFPGNVNFPDKFWTLLKKGEDAVIPFPSKCKQLMANSSTDP